MFKQSCHGGGRLQVTCAIIERDGRVLAAQRGADMSHPLKWEFPGGKIHPGESREDCVRREIREELGLELKVVRALSPSVHVYPSAEVVLYPFVCLIAEGEPVLKEHADVAWLTPGELAQLDWAAADIPIMTEYCRQAGV